MLKTLLRVLGPRLQSILHIRNTRVDTAAVERGVRHGDSVAIVKRTAAPGLDSPIAVAVDIG